MKKLTFLLLAIVIMAASCADKNAYTITGKLSSNEYDGQVYLEKLGENWDYTKRVRIDSVNVVDGQYVFKGLAKEEPMLCYIVFENPPKEFIYPIALLVEPGNIEVIVDTLPIVKGTTTNDIFQAWNNDMSTLSKERYGLYKKIGGDSTIAEEEKKIKLEKHGEETWKMMNDLTYGFIKENVNTEIGIYHFVMSSYYYSDEQIKDILDLMNEKYRADESIQKIEFRVKAKKATAVGQPFTDIKGKTPERKDIALSDYAGKGKYVLIDFWASWCGPCIRELPKVQELYKKYKDKGFEVVGISLDDNNDAWTKAIEKHNIPWPQISDLKGWDNEGARLYAVKSIPYLILIDKDGKIIENGIRTDEAIEKITELLK